MNAAQTAPEIRPNRAKKRPRLPLSLLLFLDGIRFVGLLLSEFSESEFSESEFSESVCSESHAGTEE